MKYLSVQREKSRKYSQSWQRQHAADELKTVAKAVGYLSEHGISTLAELDATLSSVSDQADAIRAGMKTAEQRMKELQKLIEYGKNYTEYKPIHDELKKLKNGWTSKRDKYEEAHRAELTLWNAASRYLHANLPKGTKSLPIAELRITRSCTGAISRKESAAFRKRSCWNNCTRNSTLPARRITMGTACRSAM